MDTLRTRLIRLAASHPVHSDARRKILAVLKEPMPKQADSPVSPSVSALMASLNRVPGVRSVVSGLYGKQVMRLAREVQVSPILRNGGMTQKDALVSLDKLVRINEKELASARKYLGIIQARQAEGERVNKARLDWLLREEARLVRMSSNYDALRTSILAW